MSNEIKQDCIDPELKEKLLAVKDIFTDDEFSNLLIECHTVSKKITERNNLKKQP